MKKYKIKGNGVTPTVWNRISMELRKIQREAKKDELETIELKYWMLKAEIYDGKKIMSDVKIREIVEDSNEFKGCYMVAPPDWFGSNLYNSAKQTRIIPWYATSKNQTYTNYISNLKISPGKPIIIGKVEDVKKKEAMLPSQPGTKKGGKVLRCHPILQDWNFEFEIIDTVGKMKIDELKELMNWGGMAIGVGDQRIYNFGRFEVMELKELK